ncbi:MAG TPA: glycosyltransferase [Afipia sp.]
MKIVDVCAFLSPSGGGVKTYIEQKLAIGPQLGHDITIIAPGDRHEVFERGKGARIVTLPSPRFPLDRKYWYFADEPALHAALDAAEPDFVEVSSPWRSANVVARWPGRVPRALIMHADPLSAHFYRWFEPLFARTTIDRGFEPFWAHLRELGRSFDRVVCASSELRDRMAGGGVANTVLLPMGVEEGAFNSSRSDARVRRDLLKACELPESAHLLIGVGRLSPEKRWPMVVDAVMAASQSLPIGLVILGQGRHRSRVLRHVRGNPHIRLLPPIRDRRQFATVLASADALIHGCEAETFCLAAAEARASGVPVIVPDLGGAADHARDGAGLTYRAGNPLSAAWAIATMFDTSWQLPTVRSSALTMRDHFKDLFELYAGLCEGSQRAA